VSRTRSLSLLAASAALIGPAYAHPQGLPETPAALVAVSLAIDGRPASLYPAPDGSGRYYVEACRGGRYSVTLANRTRERVGIVLTVDGLNAISGERDFGLGRMYVLDPWQRTSVQGWRTSLSEVRQSTFVDERASYAARAGKANEKMGWIEVAVYREHRALAQVQPPHPLPQRPAPADEQEGRGRAEANAAPEPSSARDAPDAPAAGAAAKARSYPGTGWGERTHDPVMLVSFDPEANPYERVTLRYEYRPALVALGVVPPRTPLFRIRYASSANSFAVSSIFRPARRTSRRAGSSSRSASFSSVIGATGGRLVMARSRASSSAKSKGFAG